MIQIGNIIKTTTPEVYCFKVESTDIELLERMREELKMTTRYKGVITKC